MICNLFSNIKLSCCQIDTYIKKYENINYQHDAIRDVNKKFL